MNINIVGQKGFSLLEVAIATIIVAIGLVGIASLQLTSNVYSEASLQRSHASVLAREIFERMRVNHVVAKAGNYDIASLPTATDRCGGADTNCTVEQLKDHDLTVWSFRVRSLLPGSDAVITTSEDDGQMPVDVAVTLLWDQNRGQSPQASETFNFKLMGFDQ